jgi:outer membrane lipoprotein-sorting protein
MKSRLIFSGLLVVMLIMTGCARFIVKPEKTISAAAGDLLERVSAINTGLTASKGIGTLSFQNTHTPVPRMRFAWLCSLPDRIRLEILAPTGNPLLTITADGNYFYVLPRTDNGRLHKEKAKNINLEKAIAVPLTISDAVSLLTGGIPLREFDTAERIDRPGGEYLLRLKRHRPDRTENIIFDETTSRPRKIEFLRGSGDELEYSITFSGTRTIDERTIPESIILQGNRGETVVITINRFWPEADVPAEKFILSDTP